MFELHLYLSGLIAILIIAAGTWVLGTAKRDVSVVDSVWPILFLAAAYVYIRRSAPQAPRDVWMLALVAIWAIRLAVYLTWRNWGEPEDHRYQAIRANNQPNFAFKSLFIVFLLQGVLAWIVSLPLLATANSTQPMQALDYLGALVVLFGIWFETIADTQLAGFKADAANRGKVLDHGLWRYTRHPNYFGEFCVWWGFYLMAVGAGGWWTLPGPLLMSVLLLKVSGVTLLEKDISERRPGYRDYIQRTNTFFPGKPRPASSSAQVRSP
jgi:steroid 5-alpha reductase family enzyme